MSHQERKLIIAIVSLGPENLNNLKMMRFPGLRIFVSCFRGGEIRITSFFRQIKRYRAELFDIRL